MKYIFLILCLTIPLMGCQINTDSLTDTSDASWEGVYMGYRTQTIGQTKATDSTQIVLEVERIAPDKMRIRQTSPNVFDYHVTMKSNHFVYSRGLGESTCGVVDITGEGYFRNNSLYLLETSECLNKNILTNSYTRLRAKK